MTLPTLIQNHQKKVTVTRLKKFYTTINQAVKMSEAENGSYQEWEYPIDGDEDARMKFYNKYFAKYLKTTSVESYSQDSLDNDGNPNGEVNNFLLIKFADGSAMTMRTDVNGTDIAYYVYASQVGKSSTRYYFSFMFNKSGSVGNKSFVEPYSFLWDGTREHLLSHPRYGCGKFVANAYCARLIQYDGWQIKDDYPW